MEGADERTPLNPDLWRRIGAVLDRLAETDLDLQPAAIDEACRAEGVPREAVEPFLTAERRCQDFAEQVDPALLHRAFAALASTTAPMFEAGTRLGSYEIVALLGTGGMGDVYKARDTRLGRSVALKVLRRELTERPEARQRFERETRAISSLNHPHICTVHDVGQHDLVPAGFLVMELVDGETLAGRLLRGPLRVEEALDYAAQVADALAAAHRQGIVHRDLKPANVMLTAHGVKLLDFGLATLRFSSEPIRDVDGGLTAEGAILGTLHYMAPEQIQGKPTDERTDIFALGVILYEMLTRRRPFDGDNPATVVAAVLSHPPPHVSLERPDVPAALDRVIDRCLAKTADSRWHSAVDLASELRWVRDAPGPSVRAIAAPRPRIPARAWLAASVVLAIIAVALGIYWFARRELAPAVAYRFAVPPPEGTIYTRLFALSPDGHRLIFTGTDAAGVNALWLRPLDALTSQRIQDSDGANYPFWSPDNRSVGFFADRKLKILDVATGVIRVLCDAGPGGGGTWNADGVIVFAAESGVAASVGLMRVRASGGEPTALTSFPEGYVGLHTWPQFLPDGRHYLYTRIEVAKSAFLSDAATAVYVGSLDGNDVKRILSVNRATYANGALFYVRDGRLLAQPFDPTRLELAGEAMQIADDVEQTAPGRAAYDASANGVVAYRIGRPRLNTLMQLTLFDRAGREVGRVGEPGRYPNAIALSPDGRQVLAVSAGKVLRIDVNNGTATPLPETGATAPVWSPDGTRVAFTGGVRDRPGPLSVSVRAVDGSGSGEMILPLGQQVYPNEWSANGQFIVGSVIRADTGYDLFATRVGSQTATYPVASRFDETDPDLSPDMRWIAYAATDESRHWDVYVRPFADAGGVWRVSRAGGRHPRWSGDGRELFFVSPEGALMSASVSSEASFRVTDIRELFQHTALGLGFNTTLASSPYDVASDGQRFLVGVPVESGMPQPILILLNWRALVQR